MSRTNLPDELTVHMTGWREKTYLPWYPPRGHETWEESVTLPLNRLPEEEIGLPTVKTYRVSSDERFFKTESGLWSMAMYQSFIHPDDIWHLSEPFIEWPFSGKNLIIPLEYRETKDQYGSSVVQVRCYWATTVHFPGSFSGNMKGFGITVWRCCLMPLPVACDIATLPLQMLVWVTVGVCRG